MVKQYPHILRLMEGAESTYDEVTGIHTSGTLQEGADSYPCREEPNSYGRRIGIDGQLVDYSSMVFLPLDSPDLIPGVKFRVYQGDSIRFQGEVKRFSRGQLNCKVWA